MSGTSSTNPSSGSTATVTPNALASAATGLANTTTMLSNTQNAMAMAGNTPNPTKQTLNGIADNLKKADDDIAALRKMPQTFYDDAAKLRREAGTDPMKQLLAAAQIVYDKIAIMRKNLEKLRETNPDAFKNHPSDPNAWSVQGIKDMASGETPLTRGAIRTGQRVAVGASYVAEGVGTTFSALGNVAKGIANQFSPAKEPEVEPEARQEVRPSC